MYVPATVIEDTTDTFHSFVKEIWLNQIDPSLLFNKDFSEMVIFSYFNSLYSNCQSASAQTKDLNNFHFKKHVFSMFLLPNGWYFFAKTKYSQPTIFLERWWVKFSVRKENTEENAWLKVLSTCIPPKPAFVPI